MEPIVVPFTPAYDDWLHARRILRRTEKLHYFYDFGLPVGMSVGILAALIQRPYRFVPIAIGVLLSALFFVVPMGLRRLKWKQQWRKHEGQALVEISEAGVSLRDESPKGKMEALVAWQAITAFEEDPRIFFFLTKGSMLFIPKSNVETEQAQAIRVAALRKVTTSC